MALPMRFGESRPISGPGARRLRRRRRAGAISGERGTPAERRWLVGRQAEEARLGRESTERMQKARVEAGERAQVTGVLGTVLERGGTEEQVKRARRALSRRRGEAPPHPATEGKVLAYGRWVTPEQRDRISKEEQAAKVRRRGPITGIELMPAANFGPEGERILREAGLPGLPADAQVDTPIQAQVRRQVMTAVGQMMATAPVRAKPRLGAGYVSPQGGRTEAGETREAFLRRRGYTPEEISAGAETPTGREARELAAWGPEFTERFGPGGEYGPEWVQTGERPGERIAEPPEIQGIFDRSAAYIEGLGGPEALVGFGEGPPLAAGRRAFMRPAEPTYDGRVAVPYDELIEAEMQRDRLRRRGIAPPAAPLPSAGRFELGVPAQEPVPVTSPRVEVPPPRFEPEMATVPIKGLPATMPPPGLPPVPQTGGWRDTDEFGRGRTIHDDGAGNYIAVYDDGRIQWVSRDGASYEATPAGGRSYKPRADGAWEQGWPSPAFAGAAAAGVPMAPTVAVPGAGAGVPPGQPLIPSGAGAAAPGRAFARTRGFAPPAEGRPPVEIGARLGAFGGATAGGGVGRAWAPQPAILGAGRTLPPRAAPVGVPPAATEPMPEQLRQLEAAIAQARSDRLAGREPAPAGLPLPEATRRAFMRPTEPSAPPAVGPRTLQAARAQAGVLQLQGLPVEEIEAKLRETFGGEIADAVIDPARAAYEQRLKELAVPPAPAAGAEAAGDGRIIPMSTAERLRQRQIGVMPTEEEARVARERASRGTEAQTTALQIQAEAPLIEQVNNALAQIRPDVLFWGEERAFASLRVALGNIVAALRASRTPMTRMAMTSAISQHVLYKFLMDPSTWPADLGPEQRVELTRAANELRSAMAGPAE